MVAVLAAAVVLVAGLATAGYMHWQGQRADEAQAAALTATARQLCESGDHALAWQRYGEAVARYPKRPALLVAREDCGMHWLRNIHAREGKETFTDIVDRIVPVLAEAAISASGQRAADLHAHLGWADFLRTRDGATGLDPPAHYRQALSHETSNVFAHAMWAHHIMARQGPLEDARKHFAAALASGRERAFVRTFQFAALLYHHASDAQIEAARVANDMRKSGEAIDRDLGERLWTYVYYDGLLSSERREGFMAAMHDADNAATFRWLFPESQVRQDRAPQWRFLMASLEEAAGERAAARARYESLHDELVRERAPGRLLEGTIAALNRLQRP
jgi:hypothetical protein